MLTNENLIPHPSTRSILSSLATPTNLKFSLAEIMLPDRFHLRVSRPVPPHSRPRAIANWPAYKFGVETMLRARGLEGHLRLAAVEAEAGARDPRRTEANLMGSTSEQRQEWAAEEEVCKAIIGFNVRDFSEIFGESPLSERSAAEIWKWLGGLDKQRAWAGMKLKEEDNNTWSWSQWSWW